MALERIVADKREAVRQRMRDRPLESFQGSLQPSDRSLERALRESHTGFIFECKKASPSRGLIRQDFDPRRIAKSYSVACDAISVLTDEPYFQGRFEYLQQVRETVSVPVLCKDFVVDPYQVFEARMHGADAILLMCSVLEQTELEQCLAACREMHIDALVEIHDAGELDRAIAAQATMIGVNNRNLTTLDIDLDTTRQLAPKIPESCVRICESGIADHGDVLSLRKHCDAFLVGSSLMQQADLDAAVRQLVYGRVKICGLTTAQDARAARQAGAVFGGLVLWAGSSRGVTVSQAESVVTQCPLAWVGVFVAEEPHVVAEAAGALRLHAVQLHGNEDRAYVERLRALLPAETAIWKAERVGQPDKTLPKCANAIGCDRMLLDAYKRGQPGGTGESFDWRIVEQRDDRADVILSGGLGPTNAAEASALRCWALDLSSGVESEPGRKDHEALAALFSALRG